MCTDWVCGYVRIEALVARACKICAPIVSDTRNVVSSSHLRYDGPDPGRVHMHQKVSCVDDGASRCYTHVCG